jgi:hypothetical protein
MSNVEIAVLAFDREVPVWHSHAFVIFDDPVEEGAGLVHVEAMGAALNLSDPAAVERYRAAFAALRGAAVSGPDVLELLTRIMTEVG